MNSENPNIVLVTIDCLRYDRCGFNGHYRSTTPTLNKIARESYVFDRAFATGNCTTESIPGILAGVHSFNGVQYGDNPAWKAIHPTQSTIASYLRSLGYQTIASITNPHLSTDRNFDIGFNCFNNLRFEGEKEKKEKTNEADNNHLMTRLINKLKAGDFPMVSRYMTTFFGRIYQYISDWPSVRGEVVVDTLLRNINRLDNTPFFAWTHLMDLHKPIHPDAARTDIVSPDYALSEQFSIDAHASTNKFDQRYAVMYDNALYYVDTQIQNIVNYLKDENIWNQTILIVTGDHGEALYDRGIHGHPRHYPFDEVLHVPLIIKDTNGESTRFNHSVSLAWLGDLISELITEPNPSFPGSIHDEASILNGNSINEFVLSDSLDANGHSISIRNDEYRYITESTVGDADLSDAFTSESIECRISTNTAERLEIDSQNLPDTIKMKAEDILTSPADIPTIEGELNKTTERRLQKLGYKM